MHRKNILEAFQIQKLKQLQAIYHPTREDFIAIHFIMYSLHICVALHCIALLVSKFNQKDNDSPVLAHSSHFSTLIHDHEPVKLGPL